MTQRNPMNDRYSDENRTGKTRKSSASAKPKATRAATVRDPAPKTKKQKKQEARERERAEAQKSDAMQSLQGRFEETEGYKRLRRFWWAALIGAIVCTGIAFFLQREGDSNPVSMAVMIAAYILIILAFYIDLGKIRKERKLYNASIVSSKSKAARKEQKKMRAEQRAQEKEAAEKFEAAKAEEEAKKEARRAKSPLKWFKKDKDTAEATEKDDEPATAADDAKGKNNTAKAAEKTDKPATENAEDKSANVEKAEKDGEGGE